MISDEERREVARRMRAAVEQCDQSLGVFDQEMLSILGIGLGECEGFSNPKDVARLADLIDRPTCTVSMGVTGHVGVCMRCGALIETRAAVFNAIEALPTRYCPNCGAEVVSDGDD